MRGRSIWIAGAVLLATLDASAATVLVTNLTDTASVCPSANACTLRGAIAFATPDDRIEFAPALVFPATLQLAGTELTINKNLTLVGPGAEQLAVRAAGSRRVASITSGSVTIERIAMVDGRALTPNGSGGPAGSGAGGQSAQIAEGGCIRTSAGTSLVLRQVAMRSCEARGGDGGAGGSGNNAAQAGDGGNGGSGGRASGGAIASLGQLTLIESSVQASFARGGAGGAGGTGGEAGTFGNEGEGGNGGPSGLARGGALYINTGGALLVRNSTFVGNGASSGAGGRGGDGGDGAAQGEGGGGDGGDSDDAIGGQLFLGSSLTLADIEFSSFGPATIVAGFGGLRGVGTPDGQMGLTGTGRPEIYFSDTVARIKSSFFIGSDVAWDCEGLLQAFGNNADGDNTCAGFNLQGAFAANFRGPAIDVQGGRAVLLPLSGSMVVDAATCTDVLGMVVPSDQNGRARPVDGNFDGTATCDVGAIEFEPRLFGNGFEQ